MERNGRPYTLGMNINIYQNVTTEYNANIPKPRGFSHVKTTPMDYRK
jgi:hypothetical protein